jgi:hypothetical protein
MLNKYNTAILLTLLLIRPSYADMAPTDINGAKGSALQFSSWNDRYGGWNDIAYTGANGAFKLYTLPHKVEPTDYGVVASSDADTISPDKKYLIIQRTEAGEITDEQGNNIISAQAYCDAISLENGCIKKVGGRNECEGTWTGQKFKMTTGGIFDFSKEGVSPKQLITEVSGLSLRAPALKESLFMGVSSYMACYPPQGNITEYNNIGFYLAQDGEHLLAMQIYSILLKLAPGRTPLKINVADTLWALNKQDDAKSFYTSYRDAMLKQGRGSKIPARVNERLH